MMQAERGRRNNGFAFSEEMDGLSSSSFASSSSSSSPLGANYIEHRVSKMDTVAGVAIKYGVEVADIRRMNGLVSDLQMFAHKSLQIPLPGRHPPSPVLTEGLAVNGEHTPPRRPLNDVLDSFQSLQLNPRQCKVSSAMSSLQGYYGLTPPRKGPVTETEMTVYRSGKARYLEDQPTRKDSPVSEPPPGRHRKSRSLVNVNGLFPENGEIADASDNSEAERSIRRRQKADGDPYMPTFGGFLGRTGKSLALRLKSGSRADAVTARMNATQNGGDPSLADGFAAAVRKSSSTSSLQESENGYGSSIWPSSMWTLKPDTIARPIFDGLPKPTTIRRNKAALD